MAAAKRLKTNPRELAAKVVDQLDLAPLAQPPEVAGPGFINLTLNDEFLARQATAALADDRLGVEVPDDPQTVVVDYCSPNLAKEMHVGHLRSSIIGDAVARMLEFQGHRVIRQNHVGDWGTQFGMLLAHLRELPDDQQSNELADLESFYKAAKKRYDMDTDFAKTAREFVVKLQGGDPAVVSDWQTFIDASLQHCDEVCDLLNITLSRKDIRAESSYNADLPTVVDELDRAGLLSESQGARVVFLEGFTNKDGEPLPVIVQKSDGGYLYSTTDLAAIRHRCQALQADRVLYAVDARQSLHFQQIFAVARKAGFADEHVSLEHVAFGTILGPDNRPFKTRDGGTVKLMDLLTEARNRALDLVTEKNPQLPAADRQEIARVVGIGAVKYADLSQNRASDYVFSWEKMLSLEGNTAPYMQYAYARIMSIFRKADVDPASAVGPIQLTEPAERTLALKLLRLPETLSAATAEAHPHLVCTYLFDVAGAFMSFYENCPVLQAERAEIRNSRLGLCRLTARTIRKGLELLGIETLEAM
jgi:arginyl-tRNA synthetase